MRLVLRPSVGVAVLALLLLAAPSANACGSNAIGNWSAAATWTFNGWTFYLFLLFATAIPAVVFLIKHRVCYSVKPHHRFQLYSNPATRLVIKTIFVLTFLAPVTVFSQGQVIGSFPTIDGGFEAQASSGTASLGTLPFTVTQSNYTKNNTNASVTFYSTGGRSGPQYIDVTTTSTANQGFFTPTAPLAQNTSYVVQYFFKNPSTSTRSFILSASPDGGANI